MIKNYIFKSDRLGFRNWQKSDKQPFAAMCNDSIVMEYFPNTLSIIESNALIERLISHFKKHGFTFFAVDCLETGKFIGFIGLVHSKFDAVFTPCIEIGWRLNKESWGKGFATEGAQRCLQYAFNNLKIDEIYAITALDNWNSENVMQKIGMKKQGTFLHPALKKGHWLEEELYYKIENLKKTKG